MTECHNCKAIDSSTNMSILYISFKDSPGWYLVIWHNKNKHNETNECHQILYCPWCGKNLGDVDE